MDFKYLSKVIDNNKLINDYFEEIDPPSDIQYRQSRKQGVLKTNDPLRTFQRPDINDVNIVWITGMWSGRIPGTGNYSELLKPLGFNVKVVKTMADVISAGLGRIARHLGNNYITNYQQQRAAKHVAANQEKVSQEMGEMIPDIIVGSSQGGAIAISIAPRFPNTPMLLVAPAWKIFNVQPTTINKNSIIIHGARDLEVPYEDSVELSEILGIPLVKTSDGHIIIKGFWQIVQQLSRLATGVLKKLMTTQQFESTQPQNTNIWIL